MKKVLSIIAVLCLMFASLACSRPLEPTGQATDAIKRSKIIEFPTSAYVTLLLAHEAAEVHRVALVAAGDTWATAGWPGAGPIDRLDGTAAGLYIGTYWGTVNGVEEPRLPDPVGTNRINFVHADYFAPPAVQ